jgi:replicative DNA helicase
VPPNALEAERAVLGGILLENEAMNVVLETLSVNDFYSEANAKIFEAMTELFRRSQPVDQVTLRESLVHGGKLGSVGGDEYLLSLSNTIPSVSNIQAHARIVREKSIVRALIQVCHEVASRGYGDYGPIDEFVDQSESSIYSVARERARNPYEHVKDVVMRTFQATSNSTR